MSIMDNDELAEQAGMKDPYGIGGPGDTPRLSTVYMVHLEDRVAQAEKSLRLLKVAFDGHKEGEPLRFSQWVLLKQIFGD